MAYQGCKWTTTSVKFVQGSDWKLPINIEKGGMERGSLLRSHQKKIQLRMVTFETDLQNTCRFSSRNHPSLGSSKDRNGQIGTGKSLKSCLPVKHRLIKLVHEFLLPVLLAGS